MSNTSEADQVEGLSPVIAAKKDPLLRRTTRYWTRETRKVPMRPLREDARLALVRALMSTLPPTTHAFSARDRCRFMVAMAACVDWVYGDAEEDLDLLAFAQDFYCVREAGA